MHPKHISISDFTYHLPDESIARYPLDQRDASKLLVYRHGKMDASLFSQLPQQLPSQAMLVFNNTKVIEARLLFEKSPGSLIEIFALEPHEQYADITTAMNEAATINYLCLVGGASKWKQGQVLKKYADYQGQQVAIEARMLERRPNCFVIQFSWQPTHLVFAQVLHLLGQIPIPPYLQRAADSSDNERYQTVYARHDGSVAAPTAGLHFTPQVLQQLQQQGVQQAYVTLHVGAGTFMPVKCDTMAQHDMHAEFLEVSTQMLRQLIDQQQVIPVGTTSMRTLESLYWMGVKTIMDSHATLASLEISQWEVYDHLHQYAVDRNVALNSLLHWMERQNLEQLVVKTQILIAPGYVFKVCKGLITNFHQPNSTLLLLVSALIGPQWRQVYDFALANNFRFLSYGDSSLLLP